jgi:hypothetical protein
MAPVDLLDAVLPQTFSLYKTQYLRRAIKRDMHVNITLMTSNFSITTKKYLSFYILYRFSSDLLSQCTFRTQGSEETTIVIQLDLKFLQP